MCGILVTHGLDRPFNHRMLGSLRRRGPDQLGFWSDANTHLAHTRLAIIGLDERGAEPLENDRHVLAYNGEIYNFIEIRRRLEADGIRVQGTTDAEVLLHGWTRWGKEILKSLEGFWAFVVYDKQAKTLTLVRDQFGVKPLYYWAADGRVCVSSMIRTILEVTEGAAELDYTAMSEYVRYQFTFGEKTFIRKLHKVLPGEIVEIGLSDGRVAASTYEDIFAPGGERQDISDPWLASTTDLLAQCVLDSTISDTSFTTLCSGGLDSTLITRIVRPELAYHCNFSDPDCNETFFAQDAVRGIATRLFVVNAQESFNLVERLGDIIGDFDELSVGSVILPLDDLLAQAKRRFKVVLAGTGGDELFAGYVRYQLALGHCYQDSYRGLHARMQEVPGVAARFELAHRKGDPALYRFYEPEVERTFAHAFASCRTEGNDLGAMLTFDRRHFLPALLNIDDKMCARHSMESRPSLLHQRLVRQVCSVKSTALLTDVTLKPVLRQLADGLVPRSILHRSDKMGFTTPIGTFVNYSSHLIREQLTSSPFRDLYDLKRMNFTAETKFSREVFGLLMLDLWLNRYAGRWKGGD